jgi:PAS domain S-box-containing protein
MGPSIKRHFSRSPFDRPLVWIITLLGLSVALFLFLFQHWLQTFYQQVEIQRQQNLRQLVSVAYNAIQPVLDKVRGGTISALEGRNQVRKVIRSMTYEDQYGRNYIFMSAYDGTMLVQPFESEKEMTNQGGLRDAHGLFIIQELIQAAQRQPSGSFVRYYYHLPGVHVTQEKLAYVMGLPELESYIGTGMYMQKSIIEQEAILHRTKYGAIGLMVLVFIPVIIAVITIMRRNRLLITEMAKRRQVEEALSESEEHFRAIFESSADGIVILDEQFHCLTANPAAVEMFGFANPENMQGLTPVDVSALIQPDGRTSADSVAEISQRLAESGKIKFEWRIRKQEGEIVPAEVSLIEFCIGGKRFFQTRIQDITERKRAEESLRQSEKKYRELVENANSIILRIDARGRLTFFNEFAQSFFGYREEEILGKNVVGAIVPEIDSFRVNLREMIAEICKCPELYATNENENIKCNGEKVWVAWANKAIKDEAGNLVEILCIGNDITERKRAEETLRQSEARLAEAQRLAHLGNWQWDIVPDKFFCSEEGYRILGLQPEEYGHALKVFINLVHPDDREFVRQAVDKALYEKMPYSITFRILLPEGQERVLHSQGQFFLNEGGEPIRAVGTMQDITEQQRLEAEKKKLESQLIQAQKMEAIGTLAGGIAHDFNNILMIILGFTEVVMEDLPAGSEDRDQLEQVLQAGLRARELVQQILAFSRQSTGERKSIQLKLIFKEALKMLRATLPTTIDIQQKLHSDAFVAIDPTQAQQIIMNLGTNAYHAMRDKGGILEVALDDVEIDELSSIPYLDLRPGPYVKLTVTDNGEGIDAAVGDRIFEPYFTTKAIGDGTGLGLAVVHGIVKGCGGVIKVYSEPGRGTAFHIYLPRLQKPQVVEVDQPSLRTLVGGTEHLLVVDDEEMLVTLLSEQLKKLEYRVTASKSSIEAWNVFQTQPDSFDLVITDQTMPRMTGVELSKELLRLRPDLPIILCTGFSDGLTPKISREAGIKELLIKPLIMRELSEKVRQLLDSG